jgi:hypothetical protein
MTTLQMKDFPDDLLAKLKSMAALARMTLKEFVTHILKEAADKKSTK